MPNVKPRWPIYTAPEDPDRGHDFEEPPAACPEESHYLHLGVYYKVSFCP